MGPLNSIGQGGNLAALLPQLLQQQQVQQGPGAQMINGMPLGQAQNINSNPQLNPQMQTNPFMNMMNSAGQGIQNAAMNTPLGRGVQDIKGLAGMFGGGNNAQAKTPTTQQINWQKVSSGLAKLFGLSPKGNQNGGSQSAGNFSGGDDSGQGS